MIINKCYISVWRYLVDNNLWNIALTPLKPLVPVCHDPVWPQSFLRRETFRWEMCSWSLTFSCYSWLFSCSFLYFCHHFFSFFATVSCLASGVHQPLLWKRCLINTDSTFYKAPRLTSIHINARVCTGLCSDLISPQLRRSGALRKDKHDF